MCAANAITDGKNMTKETFRVHCSDHSSAVVGMAEWKTKETQMKASEMATPSDEAFCLVALENNCNRWTAMAEKKPRFEDASNQATKHPRKKKNCGHHQSALNRKVQTKKT